MSENEISYLIRGAIFKVFNSLGPGLFESVYEVVLLFELKQLGLRAEKQVPLPVYYEDQLMDIGFKIDILVENKVIIEIKSIEELTRVHHKQVITYLKLSGKKLALLVNFNCSEIDKSIYRKVNFAPDNPIH